MSIKEQNRSKDKEIWGLTNKQASKEGSKQT